MFKFVYVKQFLLKIKLVAVFPCKYELFCYNCLFLMLSTLLLCFLISSISFILCRLQCWSCIFCDILDILRQEREHKDDVFAFLSTMMNSLESMKNTETVLV